MKQYYVEDRGVTYAYTDQEKAETFARKAGSEVIEKTEWKYSGINETGNSKEYTVEGKSFIETIENNFEKIMKHVGALGFGYKLRAAKLEQDGDRVNLIVDFLPIRKLDEYCEEQVNKIIKITGVTEEEFTGCHEFEILKKHTAI